MSFRLRYSAPLKLFSIFLGVTVVTESCAYYLPGMMHLKTNYPIYNIFMLVEYCIYVSYFKLIIKSKKRRSLINVSFYLIPVAWFLTTFLRFGLFQWNSYMIIIGDCLVICFCVFNFYELFTAKQLRDLKSNPEFWISVGIFIYSCCELPITGLLNFLGQNFATNILYFYDILQVLNIFMYSIFIYAYLCPIKTNTTKY